MEQTTNRWAEVKSPRNDHGPTVATARGYEVHKLADTYEELYTAGKSD